jgi:hypothetical protein
MTVMSNEDPALPDAPKDAEDALRMGAFTILSRLQSGTEEVVRLDAALEALAMERERCAKLCDVIEGGRFPDGLPAAGFAAECALAIREGLVA